MALKAGRVGVDPSQVDMAGNIIGGGSGSDSYTKEEADAKFATKTETADFATKASLTANENEFTFAYDESSQKYGYKLNGAGDFIPFSEAGVIGMNLPDAIMTGITWNSGSYEYVEGGYQIVNNNIFYADFVLKKLNSGNYPINLPVGFREYIGVAYKWSDLNTVRVFGGNAAYIGSSSTTPTNSFSVSANTNDYIRYVIACKIREV